MKNPESQCESGLILQTAAGLHAVAGLQTAARSPPPGHPLIEWNSEVAERAKVILRRPSMGACRLSDVFESFADGDVEKVLLGFGLPASEQSVAILILVSEVEPFRTSLSVDRPAHHHRPHEG